MGAGDAAIAQIQSLFGLSEIRGDPRYSELLLKINFPQ
jgi:hypothetical protein